MPYARTRTGPLAALDMVPVYRAQLEGCRLRAEETCLIITDTAYDPAAATACLRAALDLGAIAMVLTLPSDRPFPGAHLAGAFAGSDLVVLLTPLRAHYDPHLRAALDAGRRALMAVQPPHVLQRLTVDEAVVERTKVGAARLARAERLAITSRHGTELRMRVAGRPALAHYGVADEPGHFDFWGGAMVEIAPHEGSVEGTLVLARGAQVFHLGRFVDDPVRLTIEGGLVTAIEGGLDADLLRRYLDDHHDPNAYRVGHVAWGTDHRARWTAQLVQFPDAGAGNADAEGYLGSIQVELGCNDDQYFRGSIASAVHLGLCLLDADLVLDDETVIEAGRFVGSLATCQPGGSSAAT
jgi:2,5-dihydroxypyridine 5,6-dioxygenase